MAGEVELTDDQARRLALGAQGFGPRDRRPTGRVDRRHVRRVFERIGLIQIDSVNVVARSQELVLFARLGDHPRSLIPDATRDGELFEYWVHEASHLPMADYPSMRWKMARGPRSQRFRDWGAANGALLAEVRRRIDGDGPIAAGDLEMRVGPKGAWWDWDDGKLALEYLFYVGEVSATRRAGDFARLYDLT